MSEALLLGSAMKRNVLAPLVPESVKWKRRFPVQKAEVVI
jgi:hypothetical protein